MKTAEEILSEISDGLQPSYNGNGWVDMYSGGDYYHIEVVLQAMEKYANQYK